MSDEITKFDLDPETTLTPAGVIPSYRIEISKDFYVALYRKSLHTKLHKMLIYWLTGWKICGLQKVHE